MLYGRFYFKLNFIPRWNSRVNRIVLIPGGVSTQDEISSRLHVNALYKFILSLKKY